MFIIFEVEVCNIVNRTFDTSHGGNIAAYLTIQNIPTTSKNNIVHSFLKQS